MHDRCGKWSVITTNPTRFNVDLRPYTLLGHSFGSFIALTHAVEHPGHAAAGGGARRGLTSSD